MQPTAADTRTGIHDAALHAESAAAGNRRDHPRVPLNAVVLMHEMNGPLTAGLPWECQAVDISRSGIGLRSRRMLYDGRRVMVAFRVPGQAVRVVFGVVRYSRYDAGGFYRVGVRFAAPPAGMPASGFGEAP